MFIKNYKKVRKLLPPPFTSDHQLYSMLFSQHDDPFLPTPSLMETSIKALSHAASLSLDDVSKRFKEPPYYPNIWPGEHYKLLAGFVLAVKPKLVVEIGTAQGVSALSMKKYLPLSSKIITFDIFSWKDDEKTILKEEDFQDGRLTQYIADISDNNSFSQYKNLISTADLLFIDVTHDGKLESEIIKKFKEEGFINTPYIIFDDIRVWSMLKMWRNIAMPKLDLTSFGHWSGTGVVQWQEPKLGNE